MARTAGNPNKIAGIRSSIPPELEERVLEAHTVNQGMYSDIDPATIPERGLVLAKNAVVRSDKTSRRPGNSIFYPLSPDGYRVLRVLDYVRGNGLSNLVRQTKASIYYCTTAAWIQCLGPVLSGTDFDPINSAVINDRYFSTNNGVNQIVEVNIGTNSYGFLGNSPEYKKVTGFFNRIVGANRGGANPDPIQIGWSGDLNFGQWDFTVDVSAGFARLIDSSEDVSDFITDVFGFDAVLVILRQKSIWMATKQPSASNPFNFFSKIPGLGCTCPNGAAKFPLGIVFPDLRTKSVYTFNIDGSVEDIGQPIRKALMAAVNDPNMVFGSYNPIEAEYSILIPNELSNITQEWRFNFRQKAWTYNELPAVSSITDVNNIAGSRTIADLQGTIGSLLGTIADLSAPVSIQPRRIYGRFDGEIAIETDGQVLDTIYNTGYGFSYGSDYGGTLTLLPANFSTILRSRVYRNPGYTLYISACNIEVFCRNIGTFTLSYSRDGGVTFVPKKIFTITASMLNQTILLQTKKLVTCRKFAWQIDTSDIDFDLYTTEIKNYPYGANENIVNK